MLDYNKDEVRRMNREKNCRENVLVGVRRKRSETHRQRKVQIETDWGIEKVQRQQWS